MGLPQPKANRMRVNVFVKRELRLGRLDFDQRQMFKLGTVAVASRKYEISQAKNARGGAAKPLTKRYAIRKTKRGKGNRRNLSFSGDMMRELSVRSVSANQAVASWTTRKGRAKALANNKREEFISFSTKNEQDTARAGEVILIQEKKPRMVLEKVLNG